MNRRTVATIASCSAFIAATAIAPAAQAGNVSWGVSVGGPGFNVTAGQPGYYGGRGYHGATYFPVARPYFRPYVRPYYHPWYRAAVAPPIAYLPPPVAYSYYAPSPVVYATRPAVYAPRRFVYAYPGYGPVPMQFAPGNASY